MKRLTSSSSFSRLDEQQDGNLIPLSLTVEGKRKYDDRFQSTLRLDGMEEVEEEDELCAMGQSCLGEKKRRLSVEQVKALEKNFEVENKLDPERKVRLAQEIGLQPRQVAVWFQNRRARWKTKLLEHDYGALKARHDALKIDCDALHRDKDALLAEITDLKAKLDNSEASAAKMESKAAEEGRLTTASAHKDGASDSDSSAVFNDESSASAYSGIEVLDERHLAGFMYHSSPLLLQDGGGEEAGYMEEGFLSGEELCSSLFSEEEAPSLSWYCSGGWD